MRIIIPQRIWKLWHAEHLFCSPEAVSPDTGWIVEKGDVEAVKDVITTLPINKESIRKACRKRAEEHFDKNKCFEEYMKLYESLIQK